MRRSTTLRFHRPLFSKLVPHGPSVLAVLASMLVLTTGCGGGSQYAADEQYATNEGRVAVRTHATMKSVHHPDSLEDVFVASSRSAKSQDGIGSRDSIGFRTGADLQSLLEKWSSAAGPQQYYKRDFHFATLYSKELALARMAEKKRALPNDGTSSSGAKTSSDSTTAVSDQIRSYREHICIHVYLFDFTRNPFANDPSKSIKLRVGDRTLYTEQKRSARGFAYLPDGQATYQRLTLVFPRIVEGTDVLERNSVIRLDLPGMEFSWGWEKAEVRRTAAELPPAPKGN